MLFPHRFDYRVQFYHSDDRLFFFAPGGDWDQRSAVLFCKIFQLDPTKGEAQILSITSYYPLVASNLSPIDKVRKILETKRYSLRPCFEGEIQKIYFQKGFYPLGNDFKEKAIELFNAGDASNIPLFTLGYLYSLLEVDEIGLEAVKERAMKHVSSHPIIAWAVLSSFNDAEVGDVVDRLGSCLSERPENCDDQDLWQYLDRAPERVGIHDTVLETSRKWAERRISLFKHDGSDPCEMVRRGIEFARSFFWAKPLPFLELSFKSYDRNPIDNRFLDVVDRLGFHYEKEDLWREAARVYRISDRFCHHRGGLTFEPLAEGQVASRRDFLSLAVYHFKKDNWDKAASYLGRINLEANVDKLEWIIAQEIGSSDLTTPRSPKRQRV